MSLFGRFRGLGNATGFEIASAGQVRSRWTGCGHTGSRFDEPGLERYKRIYHSRDIEDVRHREGNLSKWRLR